MFDRNRHYNANSEANCVLIQIKQAHSSMPYRLSPRSNMYIPVYHTNGRSIKNMIGVMNRLVGMGL